MEKDFSKKGEKVTIQSQYKLNSMIQRYAALNVNEMAGKFPEVHFVKSYFFFFLPVSAMIYHSTSISN